MRRRPLARLALLAVVWLPASVGWAGIADVLREPKFAHLELAPIAPALASTVASTYPIASASSSVVYAYDPDLGVPVRQPGVAGPIIGERARTLGRGQWDLSATYSFVRLATVNGDHLHALVNRPRVNGKTVVFPVPDGITLADGRFTNVLPVRVVADLDVTADIVSPSVTYGLTPNIDVNVTLPLLHTTLDVTADTQVPDPRFPGFAPEPEDRRPPGTRSASDDAAGIGDLLVRTKYVFARTEWVDAAAGLALSLPTGDEEDLQGTGTTRVQPTLILSHAFANRIEPLVNLGIDCNADDVDRSVIRWAVGATAQLLAPIAVEVVFLGRHELSAQADRIATPFFFQIERNDQYDASVGLRWRFAESGSVGLDAIVPLNRQGLRADAIPTIEVKYAF